MVYHQAKRIVPGIAVQLKIARAKLAVASALPPAEEEDQQVEQEDRLEQLEATLESLDGLAAEWGQRKARCKAQLSALSKRRAYQDAMWALHSSTGLVSLTARKLVALLAVEKFLIRVLDIRARVG